MKFCLAGLPHGRCMDSIGGWIGHAAESPDAGDLPDGLASPESAGKLTLTDASMPARPTALQKQALELLETDLARIVVSSMTG